MIKVAIVVLADTETQGASSQRTRSRGALASKNCAGFDIPILEEYEGHPGLRKLLTAMPVITAKRL